MNQGLISSILVFGCYKIYSTVLSVHLGLSHAAQDAIYWGSRVNCCTNTFLSVFGLRAGTQLHFRGLNFSSSVPKFWFTTTSGMCRVDHLFWNSLERKNEMQTIITFNNHCPSRNPHHTWDGTFEPMFPFRCLRKRSANRMNELESMWKALWIEKENRIWVHAPITHQENSFQVIPRDDLLPQKTLSFHIFFHSENIFKKNPKVILGLEMQPLAECEWKTFWPEGEHSILEELYGCSSCSPSTSPDSSDAPAMPQGLSAIDDEEGNT